jgi:hypothetical protein
VSFGLKESSKEFYLSILPSFLRFLSRTLQSHRIWWKQSCVCLFSIITPCSAASEGSLFRSSNPCVCVHCTRILIQYSCKIATPSTCYAVPTITDPLTPPTPLIRSPVDHPGVVDEDFAAFFVRPFRIFRTLSTMTASIPSLTCCYNYSQH